MRVALLLLVILFCGCRYAAIDAQFIHHYEQNNWKTAESIIRKQRENQLDGFLRDANLGLVLSNQEKIEESNEVLEKAYLYGEDYRKDLLRETFSYFTNPLITPYRGEDHEHLFINYYKALNYSKQGNIDDALVECRRLNLRLQQLFDRYTSDDKYRADAMMQVMMGLLYESGKDWNNAFIAYRNAVESYRTDYQRLFSVSVPTQLKKDIIRCAYLSGLDDEYNFWKNEFSNVSPDLKKERSEVVIFWHNGLAPVKVESFINFAINAEQNNVFFTDELFGRTLPFKLENEQKNYRQNLNNLHIVRMAFPKYATRKPFYTEATLQNESLYQFELLEDINQIAKLCLKERLFAEYSKTLLRFAIKKATELSMRKENQALGSLIGLVNAATERADTRCWDALPHSIFYTRLTLPEGQNTVQLTRKDVQGNQTTETFTLNVEKGKINFYTFTSPQSAGY